MGALASAGIAVTLAAAVPTSVAAQELNAARETILTAQQEGQQAQERINQIDDQTASLESEYKAVLQQLDSLGVYNRQLQELIRSQTAEMAVVEKDILRVTNIDREIIPFMLRMVDGLDQFVALDVPFLIDERRERVARLRQLMARSDASPAEKLRRVLEAYQIENEYGRTIEGYNGQVQDASGATLSVDFLRVGRVAFYYKTLDDSQLARWNRAEGRWEQLDTDAVPGVKSALAVARQQVAPDMVILPLDAPENAQ